MTAKSSDGNGKRELGKMTLRRILKYAVRLGASDIHLKVGRPPIIRLGGDIRFAGETLLTVEHLDLFLDEMMPVEDKMAFMKGGDADLALNMEDVGRFRVNLMKQKGTAAAVLRHIKSKIPDFRGLNLPEKAVRRIADARRGMVLVTGATGSGKSTTLAAIINLVNQSRADHILTLEDPIEFVHEDILSSVTQREIGIDTPDFSKALRAAMREDPDVILIGEMRDIETFEASIHAAETGHLVFSTLHTTNVMLTVDRIVDLFPPGQQDQVRTQLAHQLQAIISQRLVPRKDGEGRVPALEIMFNNPGIRALIAANNIKQIPSALMAGKNEGMQTFNMSLVALTQEGLISEEEALKSTDNPDEFKMNMQGIYVGSSGGGILKKA